MTWETNIEKVVNGYSINHWDEESEETKTVVFEYIEAETELETEQLTLQKVFYYLMDYFAVHNNKHANEGKGQYMDIKVTGKQ